MSISEIQKSVSSFSACVNAVTLKTIQNVLIYIAHFAEMCQHLSSKSLQGMDDTASSHMLQDAHTGAKIDVQVKRVSKTVTK